MDDFGGVELCQSWFHPGEKIWRLLYIITLVYLNGLLAPSGTMKSQTRYLPWSSSFYFEDIFPDLAALWLGLSLVCAHCQMSNIIFSFSSSCYFFNRISYIISKMAETRTPNKLYATHPKNYGKGSRQCRMSGRKGGMGLIRKYGIDMKRQAFRENAIAMGWSKYS